MLLDLSRLRSGADELDRRFEPSEFDLTDDEFRILAPVTLKGRLHKDGQKVRFTGRVTTTLEWDCGRCLEPFTIPVDAHFDLIYLPVGSPMVAPTKPADGAEREITDDDIAVSYYENDTIDLADVMREQFYLALPMKPLCREDCKGLCPMCGVNRNRESCSCKAVWVDPRLAVLKTLIEPKE